jgi:hypothetical protein
MAISDMRVEIKSNPTVNEVHHILTNICTIGAQIRLWYQNMEKLKNSTKLPRTLVWGCYHSSVKYRYH